jgi:hypothetical protein
MQPTASRKPPVCPLLTMAVIQPPSALVAPGVPQQIATVPCLGPTCAFFHPANVCSVNMIAEALRTQAAVMLSDGTDGEQAAASKPTGTPQ